VTRLEVRKTYKLYIGGKFPRSESGRSYPVRDAEGGFVANVAQGSRKDARDAVAAARSAVAGWSSSSAFNRGQVLYRVAEVMEGRRDQFVSTVVALEGVSAAAAAAQVDAAIDRWVWYAGWSDKLAQVAGNANPVAGPWFNLSVPEPTGVVAVLAPPSSSLLGLVSVIAPVIVSGNTAVVVASSSRPLPAVHLAECLATSDLPGGVINLLTGHAAEIAEHLAAHEDVNGLDLTGVDPDARAALQVLAAGTLKRMLAPPAAASSTAASFEPDWTLSPGLGRMLAFLETKTIWHPKGV
jgi:acyl-CoA reductase-like NAD-dependent aldehyde dehydrogenase